MMQRNNLQEHFRRGNAILILIVALVPVMAPDAVLCSDAHATYERIANELARSIAVDNQSLKLSAVGGAKAKADVIASHAENIARQAALGNLVSGGER